MRLRYARGASGIALVLVLWVVALLSTMALAMVATQRTEMALTSNLVTVAQGRALAEAGIYYAVARGILYRTSEKAERWEPDGTPHDWAFAEAGLRLAITSEQAYIDLNQAGSELLDGLLKNSGMDEDQVASLRDAILDWRDKNSEHLLHGAEDSDYLDAGRVVGAADAPFSSVSELRQVLGMTQEIYQAIAPALSVYSGSGKIRAKYAPAQVLAALPGMDETRLLDYLAQRIDYRERGLQPPQPQGVKSDLLGGGKGQVYRIYAEVTLPDGGITRQQAIVRIPGVGSPFEIMAWNYHPDRREFPEPQEELEE